MQRIRNERAPLSFGEIVVVAVNAVCGVVSGAALLWAGGVFGWLFLQALVVGLALASVGTLGALVSLLARKPSAARGFQMVGAVGGLVLIFSLVLIYDSRDFLLYSLLFGVPAAVLIGLAVYVRSITRRDTL